MFFGSALNVYSDYELDKLYKKRLSEALDILESTVISIKRLLFVELIVIVLLGAYLSIQLQNFFIFAVLIVGVFFAIAYSIEPLRFKRRGILNSITLILVLFLLPVIFSHLVVKPIISPIVFITMCGFSLAQYGITLINTMEDFFEEKLMNIQTPPVKWGLIKSTKIALMLIIIGVLFMLLGLYVLCKNWTFILVLFGHIYIIYEIYKLLNNLLKDEKKF